MGKAGHQMCIYIFFFLKNGEILEIEPTLKKQ
jgi:hypothetical protein